MIKARRLDPEHAESWETLIEKCGGHPLHLPAVHLVYRSLEELRLLRFELEGRTVACAVAFEISSRKLPLPFSGRRLLHLPTAPAILEGVDASGVWDALVAYARATRCDRLDVRPAYGRSLPTQGELAPYRTEGILEFTLDLRKGEDAVFAAMHKVHRKNIRRAARENLRVEEDSSLEGLFRLRILQLASSDRADERTEGFTVGDEELFRRLHRQVYAKGLGTLLFAYQDDRPIAALAWLTAAGCALTVRSGSLPEGYRLRAMYLLHDALIRHSLSQGLHELNIGAVPESASNPDHAQFGLYEFKRGFGGQASVRQGLDLPVKDVSP